MPAVGDDGLALCVRVGVVRLDERSAGMVTEEVRVVGVAGGLSLFITRTVIGPALLFRNMRYLPFVCRDKITHSTHRNWRTSYFQKQCQV